MGAEVIDDLGFIAWGIVIGCVGLLLLGEYRRIFFENPRVVMTLEVWFQVATKSGGPGYLAIMLLICSAIFLLEGVASLIAFGVNRAL
jgi:hypothetical protein